MTWIASDTRWTRSTASRSEPARRSPRPAAAPLALLGICVLAGLLYCWAIGSTGYGDAYYSAAVKSMTDSFSNFIFGSYDPYGIVTTDKPPLSFWPQVLSVEVFGYHSWSIILPQAVEGVATVVLLHRTVRRWAGERVALLAALILAVTPIAVALNRDNNTDALLTLLLVATAYAMTRSLQATERSRQRRWLVLAAVLLGCGFLTKWLEAWILIPSMTASYLVGAAGTLRRRMVDLLIAGGVLLLSSLWWPVLHDLWPGRQPYMGSTTDGTAMQVILGYNGLGRVFNFGANYNGSGLTIGLSRVGMSGGAPGAGRMFSREVGGQISWLLPLSLVAFVVVGAGRLRRLRSTPSTDRLRRAGWVMWGGWLVVTGLVFSFTQGLWHPYYTMMLGPAVAAVSAAGISVLWRRYRHGSGLGWLWLPLAIAVSAGWALALSSRDPSWYGWTRWVVLGLAVPSVIGLLLARAIGRSGYLATIARPAFQLGVVAMLLTPAVWCVGTAVEHATYGGFPSAGPPNLLFDAFVRGIPPTAAAMKLPSHGDPYVGFGGDQLTTDNAKILAYAVRNSGSAPIKLAVEGGALAASAFIIRSDQTVIGMGGYLGADDAPSIGQLSQLVADGRLKFILSGAPGHLRFRGAQMASIGGILQQQRLLWVQQHCAVVDPAAYGGTPLAQRLRQPIAYSDETLYSCGGGGNR